MKRFLLFVALIVLSGVVTAAQVTVVKEGVVDLQKVVRLFFSQSKQFRDQQALDDQVNKTMQGYQEEINDLQSQRLHAAEARDTAKVSQLDALIRQKNNLANYRAIEVSRLDAMKASLVVNDTFLRNLLTAVKAVAEEEGMLSVKKRTDDYLYLAPDLDISDKVITRMMSLSQTE